MTAGEPLVLLPGILCDADLWRDQIEHLASGRDCIVPLLDATTIEAMADAVLHAAPRRFALAGLSMGGYVALAIMRRSPERVGRLFLASTSARPDSPEQAAGRLAGIAEVEAGRFDRVIERLMRVLVAPHRLDDAGLVDRVGAMMRRGGADLFVRQQRAVAARPDARPALKHIAVPTRIIAGESDRVIPPVHTREIAASIDGAAFTPMAGCGHLPPLERPGEVTRALEAWLDERSTKSYVDN